MSNLRGSTDTFRMTPLLQENDEGKSLELLVLPPPGLDKSSYWSDVGFERHVNVHVGEGAHTIIQHGRFLFQLPTVDKSIATFNAVDNRNASFDASNTSNETFDFANNLSPNNDRGDISDATFDTVDESTTVFENYCKEAEEELANTRNSCSDTEGLSPVDFSVKSGDYDPSEASLPTVSISSNDFEPIHLGECEESVSSVDASVKDSPPKRNGELFDCSDSTMELAIELKTFQILDMQRFNLVKQRKGTLIGVAESRKLACLKAELEQMQKARDVGQKARLKMPIVVSPIIAKSDWVLISSEVPISCKKAPKSVEMNWVSQNQRDPHVRLKLHSADNLHPRSPLSTTKPTPPTINYNDPLKERHERRETTDRFPDESDSLKLGLRDSEDDSGVELGKLGKTHNVQSEGSISWTNLCRTSQMDQTLKYSPHENVSVTSTSGDYDLPGAKFGKYEPNMRVKRRRTVDPESALDDLEESLSPRKRRHVNTGRRSELDA